jgi:hypothetical protein
MKTVGGVGVQYVVYFPVRIGDDYLDVAYVFFVPGERGPGVCVSVRDDVDRDLRGRGAGLPGGGAGAGRRAGCGKYDPGDLSCVMIGHGNAVKA